MILPAFPSAELMVGNEFSIGAFTNPAYGRLHEQPQVYAVRETARLFGQVMPFWMPANLLLTILLFFSVADRFSASWCLYLTAAVLFAVVIVSSLVYPVPINYQIAAWNPQDLPTDRRESRRRWDKYHYVRVVLLLSAFTSLFWGTIKN